MNLFKIEDAITNCVKLEGRDDYIDVSTGEIIDTAALEQLQMDKETKLRNIGCWVLNLDAEEKALAEQIERFTARKKAIHNKKESLKSYVGAFLNGSAWKCTECEFKWRTSESVQFSGDIQNVPVEYLRMKEPELDKAKIKKALKDGVVIAGCTLEKKSNLSVK